MLRWLPQIVIIDSQRYGPSLLAKVLGELRTNVRSDGNFWRIGKAYIYLTRKIPCIIRWPHWKRHVGGGIRLIVSYCLIDCVCLQTRP